MPLLSSGFPRLVQENFTQNKNIARRKRTREDAGSVGTVSQGTQDMVCQHGVHRTPWLARLVAHFHVKAQLILAEKRFRTFHALELPSFAALVPLMASQIAFPIVRLAACVAHEFVATGIFGSLALAVINRVINGLQLLELLVVPR